MVAREQETLDCQGSHPHRCVKVYVDQGDLSFYEAKRMADLTARDVALHPMLLAWFERKTGEYSPKVECCGDDKPTWRVYAESRGGDLTVCLNNGDFEFVYRSEGKPNKRDWEFPHESSESRKGE